jgi:hypothetical protein
MRRALAHTSLTRKCCRQAAGPAATPLHRPRGDAALICPTRQNRANLNVRRPRDHLIVLKICMRANRNLLRRFNLIWVVQSPAQKQFAFSSPRSMASFSPSRPDRGAHRDRHERWAGYAVDARAARDERSSCGRRSRVVLTLRCRRQSRRYSNESDDRRWQPSMVAGEITYKL